LWYYLSLCRTSAPEPAACHVRDCQFSGTTPSCLLPKYGWEVALQMKWIQAYVDYSSVHNVPVSQATTVLCWSAPCMLHCV
jgi:hypothetical protein